MTYLEILKKHDKELNVDAVVNPINKNWIQYAPEKESEIMKSLEIGQTKIIEGCNLPAKYLINVVFPSYEDKNNYYDEKISKICYTNVLISAKENNIKSIALPIHTCFHECNKTSIETILEFIAQDKYFDNITFFDINIQILKEFSNMVDKNLRCQMLPILEPTDIGQNTWDWPEAAHEFASKLSYLNLEIENYMLLIEKNRLDFKAPAKLTRDEILALLTGYIQHDRISGGLFNSNIKSGKIRDLILRLHEITKIYDVK